MFHKLETGVALAVWVTAVSMTQTALASPNDLPLVPMTEVACRLQSELDLEGVVLPDDSAESYIFPFDISKFLTAQAAVRFLNALNSEIYSREGRKSGEIVAALQPSGNILEIRRAGTTGELVPAPCPARIS